MELLITIGAVVAGIILALVLKALWRVAEPNEALIISGFRARSSPGDSADSLGFKIVTGKGTLVLPGFQAARRLSLDTRGTSLQVSCVTKQGIPVAVRASSSTRSATTSSRSPTPRAGSSTSRTR